MIKLEDEVIDNRNWDSIIKMIEERKDLNVDFSGKMLQYRSWENIAKAIVEKKLNPLYIEKTADRNRIDYYVATIKNPIYYDYYKFIKNFKKRFPIDSIAILYKPKKIRSEIYDVERSIIKIEKYNSNSVTIRKYKDIYNQPIFYRLYGYDNKEMFESGIEIEFNQLHRKNYLMSKHIYYREKVLLDLLFNEKNKFANLNIVDIGDDYKYNSVEYLRLNKTNGKELDFVLDNPFFNYIPETELIKWLCSNENTVKKSIIKAFNYMSLSFLKGDYLNQKVDECYANIKEKVINRKKEFNPEYSYNESYNIKIYASFLTKVYSLEFSRKDVYKEISEEKYKKLIENNIIYEYKNESKKKIKKELEEEELEKPTSSSLNKILNGLKKFDEKFEKIGLKDFDTRAYVYHTYLAEHKFEYEIASGLNMGLLSYDALNKRFKTHMKNKTNKDKLKFEEILVKNGYLNESEMSTIYINYELWKKEIEKYNKDLETGIKKDKKNYKKELIEKYKKKYKLTELDDTTKEEIKQLVNKRYKEKPFKSTTLVQYLSENEDIITKNKLKNAVIDYIYQCEFFELERSIEVLQKYAKQEWRPKFK